MVAKKDSEIERIRPATSVHGFDLAVFRARARARTRARNGTSVTDYLFDSDRLIVYQTQFQAVAD